MSQSVQFFAFQNRLHSCRKLFVADFDIVMHELVLESG